MQRFLAPAQIGLDAARHLAWYLRHQINGAGPRA
jgi:hypothetical protein